MSNPTLLSSDFLSRLRVAAESYDRTGQKTPLYRDEILALVECAEALKWLRPRDGVWRTPNDYQASFAEAALKKLEAL